MMIFKWCISLFQKFTYIIEKLEHEHKQDDNVSDRLIKVLQSWR